MKGKTGKHKKKAKKRSRDSYAKHAKQTSLPKQSIIQRTNELKEINKQDCKKQDCRSSSTSDNDNISLQSNASSTSSLSNTSKVANTKDKTSTPIQSIDVDDLSPSMKPSPQISLPPKRSEWTLWCKDTKGTGDQHKINQAARKAYSRSFNDVTKPFIEALLEFDSFEQQCVILRSLLDQKELAQHTKVLGIDSEDVEFKNKCMMQLKKIYQHSSKGHQHKTDDKTAFQLSLIASLKETPPQDESTSMNSPSNAPSPRTSYGYNKKLADTLGIPYSSFKRKVLQASNLRGNIIKKLNFDSWNAMEKKQQCNKVSDEIKADLHQWIRNHPNVVSSPSVKDVIHVKVTKDDGTTEKKKMSKLLLQVSICELHDDLMKAEHEGGFKYRFDKNNKPLISDTALRNLLPPELRKMKKYQRIMCGCETCIAASTLQESLNAWRRRYLKSLQQALISQHHL